MLSIILEILIIEIRPKQEIKCIKSRKEEIKLSLFEDDMIVYIINSKKSTKQLLELKMWIQKGLRFKVNIQNQIYFCILAPNN